MYITCLETFRDDTRNETRSITAKNLRKLRCRPIGLVVRPRRVFLIATSFQFCLVPQIFFLKICPVSLLIWMGLCKPLDPIVSRNIKKNCLKNYIYPSLQHPPLCLAFDDQFAFQPTGSTTAALIHLIHSITTLLDTNPFVV